MTLRRASKRLLTLAQDVRDIAADIEPRERGLAARLRADAHDLELRARQVAVRAAAAGEPE